MNSLINELLVVLAVVGAFGFGWETRKMAETTVKVKTEICNSEQNNSKGQ